ncbi:hypothetical protein D4R99_03965 [bacterium]|nr:MAG: hypothetical protein D4R99_03965 [bacterium]
MGKNENLIQRLFDYNTEQSKEFTRFAVSEKRRFLNAHPTKIIVFECMDGRINFPLSCAFPFGVVSSFRSVGGKFDLGIPHFTKTLCNSVMDALMEKRDCLLIATYHFSKGDAHRGCKGCGYDTEAALVGAQKFRTELERAFSFVKNRVHSIVIGIETDEDRFVIPDPSSLEKLPKAIRKDLDFILAGNTKHASELPKRTDKEMQHGENIIAVGTGFDWLHSYNQALIIGPWCYDLDTPVTIAADIILSNLKEKRIADSDSVLLLCGTVPSKDTQVRFALAEKEAKALSEHCVAILKLRAPEIMPYLQILAGVTNPLTRKFSPIS